MADHVHMLLSIPPKDAVAQVIGYMKGKSAIHIARSYMGVAQKCWPTKLLRVDRRSG